MYVTVRRYEGVDEANVEQIIRVAEEGFADIISQAAGFMAFYAIDAGEGVVAAVSVFESRAGAEESDRMAAEFIAEKMAGLMPNAPQITAGEAAVYRGVEVGRVSLYWFNQW